MYSFLYILQPMKIHKLHLVYYNNSLFGSSKVEYTFTILIQ